MNYAKYKNMSYMQTYRYIYRSELFLVHLIGKVGNDRVFDERDVKFTVGEGGILLLHVFTFTFFFH